MHVLPRVRQLHERFEGVLEVVGVHAGKFSRERDTRRIADACERLGVRHPVVNDRQFRIWHDYAVKAWPTVALIDPEGYLVGVQPGEFPVDALAEAIESVVVRARERGTLAEGPAIASTVPDSSARTSVLSFPTRALLRGERLWVSDTGHHRVLECAWDERSHTATVQREHGGFAEPRGLAMLGGEVFVADRAAHCVLRLSADGEAVPVAGTGEIADYRLSPGSARRTALRSPWGLAERDGALIIAMAGSHQLWRLDAVADRLALLAGQGAEDLLDGRGTEAVLAQPTGVAPGPAGDSGMLAVADCESSAIRILDRQDAVATLVGTGLFDFGDRDGVGDEVLLQHAEDVGAHGGVLAIADTYNDRVKRLDPATRACSPWPGEAGEAGALREPGGIASDGRTLLVADTGDHRIVAAGDDGTLGEVRFA